MGESIAEGTIVRWIKKVGDSSDKDEPLFEISTDKVDAEIPAPGAGVLLDIKVKEGETVPVNSVVAVIGAAGEKVAAGSSVKEAGSGVMEAGSSDPANRAAASAQADGATTAAPATHLAPPPPSPVPAAPAEPTIADLRRTRSSPVVRKIAREHGIDFTQLPGTGISGRVTKKDILSFVASGAPAPAAGPSGTPKAPPMPALARTPSVGSGQAPPPAFQPGENVRVEKMSVMRKKIADHMVMSVKTSPHVYSAYEVDFSRIDQLRHAHKAAYEQAGTKLTYTAFIAKATVDTIRQFPFSNASVDGDNIVYKRDINLGIAVALETGLIVPVIRNADEKSMMGLCRAIQDLASRARSKKLNPEEVQGGTFTITNPGIFGAVYGLPVISQPQVAILGVGSVDKRVVVVNDMIAVRPICYLTLGFDHRLIDGADAGRFLQALKERLQAFDESWM